MSRREKSRTSRIQSRIRQKQRVDKIGPQPSRSDTKPHWSIAQSTQVVIDDILLIDLKHPSETIDLVLLNIGLEGRMIRRRTGLDENEIGRMVKTLVITRGEHGSQIRTREGIWDIPAVPPSRLVDPTGVGDGYRAGLITGIRYGLPWEVVGRMGSLAATYVLEEHGTQRHYYTVESFIRRYAECFGDSTPLNVLREKPSATYSPTSRQSTITTQLRS
jgi:hypothetical protein